MVRILPCLWLCLILFAGCMHEGAPSPNQTDALSAQLEGRLNAALAIRGTKQRDDALKAIAIDAAAAVQSDIVIQAIDSFHDWHMKDDAVAVCAAKLSVLGQQQAAVDVASRMYDPNRKDEVMERIARSTQ